ncbi:MAG TPA: aldehyde dehydrogenase family protein [Candidatus Limnocylindria bacterium]|nr:aldehyde dehydrogenase family protein [Candidatus Limnocylindria bacterium]
MTQTADRGAAERARPDTIAYGNFIGGEWRPATSGGTFESVNPADTRDVIGRFAASDAADVAAAVRAAEEALPAWRRTPAPKRGEIMYAFAALLAQHKESLSQAMTREMGKVLAEARGDVQEGIDIAYLMAGEGRRLFGDTTPSELPDKWAMSVREPVGIAGIITPWNFPVAIPCWKMMPALICGNTVVLKPASDTPHCAALLVDLMHEAGFPPGTVNLVTGGGEEAGMPIVDSPDVNVISFTGSTDTGRAIAARAARRLKRLSLELGGKNAIVVMDDADLELALDGILWSAFGTTGQRCTACSRLIVHEAVADTLLAGLQERSSALRLGPGSAPQTDVGPLINARAHERVGEYVEIARDEGARVLSGGGSARDREGLEHGHFFEPTVLDNVQPMDRVAQEEVFGPVLSVIRVGGYEEAAMVVNTTRYGLSSSIYTRDTNTAFRAMRDFTTGIVYVNAGTIGAETHLPFGGMKQTGNGHREAGHAALDTFSEWKAIYVDYSGRLQRAQIDNQ